MSLILVVWIKQEKYCDIEWAAGAPAQISKAKVRFKDYLKILEEILVKIRANYVYKKEQGALPENLIWTAELLHFSNFRHDNLEKKK